MRSLGRLGLALFVCLLVLGCAPPAGQAPSNAVASPAAPPAPLPPPSPSPSASEQPVAVSPPPPPLPAPPAETPPANPLAALSPLAAYENLDRRINAVLSKVTDGPSANAAAGDLAPLTAELKVTLRPYLRALAVMSDGERNAYLQRKMEEAIRQKSSGGELDYEQIIDLARQPGNERFHAALQSMFQTMIDEGSTGIRRSTTRLMERLNKP